MAKIIYDDGREEEFNKEDFISKAELEENYISKDELEDNYVSREKYEKKKAQAKEAYKNRDLAWKQAIEAEKESLEKSLEEKFDFKARHKFEDWIPQEILDAKAKYPDLWWEECYRLSWYQEVSHENPNPWRENLRNLDITEITTDQLVDLAEHDQAAYNKVAAGIEAGKIKQI